MKWVAVPAFVVAMASIYRLNWLWDRMVDEVNATLPLRERYPAFLRKSLSRPDVYSSARRDHAKLFPNSALPQQIRRWTFVLIGSAAVFVGCFFLW